LETPCGSFPGSADTSGRHANHEAWISHSTIFTYCRGLADDGGMEWTTDSVPSVLNQLRFIIPQYNSTNEPVPRQLTQILDALPFVAPEDADCVVAFIVWLKEEVKLLCCTCVGECTARCTCLRSDATHRGCTSWCHDGKMLMCCTL
jgi:hypothetical protein